LKSNRPYITEEQKELVRKHKYQGVEYSIAYNYFYAPICNVIVNYIPLWVAPNLLSFIGFVLNIIPHVLLFFLYGWEMEGEIGPYFLVFAGTVYIIY